MKTNRFLAAIGVACAIALSAMLPQAAVAQTNWSTPGGANASGAVGMCLNASNQAVPCSDPSALPSPVSGTFSATLAGFTPNNNFASLTATASTSASTAMPAGAVVGFQNTSSVDVSCVLSAGAATATTNKIVVRAGATVFLTVGSNVNAACINQTGSASNVVVMAGGTGLGTNFGGSTGAGGGATNITQVGGVNVPTGGGLQSGALPVDASTSSQLHTDLTAPVVAGTARIGYVSDDPCNSKIKLNAPFSTTSGGPVSLIALSGSTVIYVCSISAITDTAIKLSFIDGTGGSCASAQHAIWGSTTAASGMSLAANGGFTQGSGNGSVGVTTAASALCLLQSGTSLVAGNVSYVQQ